MEFTFGTASKGPDWLQSTATIISALAWPIAAVVICYIFRAEIGRLIDRIRKASIAGTSLDLALDEGQVRIEVAEAIAPPSRGEIAAANGMAIDQMPPGMSEDDQRRDSDARMEAIKLIGEDPLEAVERTWRMVEAEIKAVANRRGVPSDIANKPAFTLGKHLKGGDIFTAQMMGMLSSLRRTRQLALTQAELTVTEAARYYSLAIRFIDLARKL